MIKTAPSITVAHVSSSLYGQPHWHGQTTCPLLIEGQYVDGESGWAYNRFRFYSPTLGIHGAQDPLGVTPTSAAHKTTSTTPGTS